MQYFSLPVVLIKCFALNPENKFGADPSYQFQEKYKIDAQFRKKLRHRAEG